MSMGKLKGLGAVLVLSGLALVGCSSPAGDSGGDNGGGGGTTYPNGGFDIKNLPSPAYWNEQGSQYYLPNLFQFANGDPVVTVADWDARRAEIAKIVQSYEYGVMPPAPDNVTFTTDNTNPLNPIVTITVTVGSKSRDLKVGAQLPSGAGPFPALINCSGSDNGGNDDSTLNSAGWARIAFNVNTIAGENDTRSGMVTDLFGYTYTKTSNPDNPGVLMDYAWGASRIIDAIEKGAFGGKIDPKKLGVTGFSRWGKAALVIGAFAKSQAGTQIAVTMPGSSGSGGLAIERFVTPAGITSASVASATGLPGKLLYLKKIADENTDGATLAVKAVLGQAPFNQAYDDTFNGWTDSGSWGGLQTLAEARNETPSWFSLRLAQFQDLHYGLNIDYATDQPTRAPDGYLDTIPFDQHYLTALIAPRGLLFSEGFKTFRGNPEGQFLNYLAVSEVYSHLGADNSVGIKLYSIPHEHHTFQTIDFINFANAYFAGTAPLAKFKDAPFPIKDPRSKYDYLRLNWAAPGRTPIADQVQ